MKIKALSLPALKTVENNFLYWNESLSNLSLPELENVGDWFLSCNESLSALKNKIRSRK